MPAKKPSPRAAQPRPQRPTIAIYQQPDHVAGLLQQLYGQPLALGETREHSGEQESSDRGARGGEVAAGGKGKIPAIGQIEARVAANFTGGRDARELASQRTVSEYVYSQAYYLYLVRAALQAEGLVRSIETTADAESLISGDFVEFEAEFKADQIAAALDILRPGLVAQITNRLRMQAWTQSTDWGSYEDFQIATAKFKETLAADVSLATAVADAVRVDFRSDKTREYYGHIGGSPSDLVAVTICDTEHFTVSDEDRILDGHFTVLGKVTEGTKSDRPILERNKLLDKLSPEVVDQLFEDLNSTVAKGSRAVGGNLPSGEDIDVGATTQTSPLNLSLDSRVYGKSFKVVPIAIFT